MLIQKLGLILAGEPPVNSMVETMYSSGKINVVIAVLGVIVLGIIFYLTMLDRRIRKMEKKL